MTFDYSTMKKMYLTLYRTLGFGVLSLTVLTLLVYTFLMIFFAVNTTWVAPTVLSPTSDKMLQFNVSHQNMLQQQQTVQIGLSEAHLRRDVIEKKLKMLTDNLRRIEAAEKTEAIANQRLVAAGRGIKDIRRVDIERSKKISTELDRMKEEILQSLDASLITSGEAARSLATIQTFNNGLTSDQDALIRMDHLVDTTNRRRESLLGGGASVDMVAFIKMKTELQIQIDEAQAEAVQAQEVVESLSQQADTIKSNIENLSGSVYLTSKKEGTNLAFIPYTNHNVLAEHSNIPVYNCYLLVLACYEVGTVNKVYKDEQIVDFPIFNVRLNRTVRGTFVSLDLKDQEAMYSDILFVGSKPLFF